MSLKHYHHQLAMANDYVWPLLKKEIDLNSTMKVLEVGCAESGLVKAFVDLHIDCIGVEIVQGRIDLAKKLNPDLNILQGDITDDDILTVLKDPFDLIIIRDVIEHIPDQEKAFQIMHALLKPDGYLYITFPPLYSPYAGHQQNCNGFLKMILWVHLLPNSWIRFLGRKSKIQEANIDEVILNSQIGLSLARFKRVFKKTGFVAIKKDLFLSRPVFKVRWGWPVIKFPPIPILQEALSTGCEYILKKV